MTPQTKQLVEAAKAVLNRNKPVDQIYRDLDKLQEAITAYEQSTEQPEAIAGEKTIEDILSSCISGELKKGDFVYEDEAIKAMQIYASQQTALKDKQLQVQQSHIDDQDQLIFEQDKEIKELKAEVDRLKNDKWISVDERLPGKTDRYLVMLTYPEGGLDFAICVFYNDHRQYFDHFLEDLISHWQPLPQPTK